MSSPHNKNKHILLLLGDIVIIICSTYLAVFVRISAHHNVLDIYTGATSFFVVAYTLSFYIFDLYKLNYKFERTVYLARFLLAIVMASLVIAIVFYVFPSWRFGRGISFINMIIIPSGTYLWRIFFQTVFAETKRPKAISIMGAGEAGEAIYGVLRRKNDYVVKGIFDDDPGKWNQRIGDQIVTGPSSLVVDLAERNEIDAIVIAITHEKSSKLLKAVVHAKTKGIEVYDMPSLYQRLTGKLPVDHITDNWFVYNHLHGMDRNIYTKNVKRMVDIALSFTGLIVSLPVMIAVSVAIKLDSRGPVLFRQKRVGIDGKIYEIIKFRSMIKNAESNGAIWAREDDPRVTRVGRFTRKTRIDEIPQMWNVLKGDMSFIGPRPERPEFVDPLNNEIPFYHLRHAIRPGITGWAQVNYRYGASKEDAIEKLQYDIYYMKNLSPFLDLHILLRTVRVVLFGMGAR